MKPHGVLPAALLLHITCAPTATLAMVTGVAEINSKGAFIQKRGAATGNRSHKKIAGHGAVSRRAHTKIAPPEAQKAEEVAAEEAPEPYAKLLLEQFGAHDKTCTGKPAETYLFTPREDAPPNFVEGDTCIKVSNAAGKDAGHVQMSCQDGLEIHINEFLGAPEDESCGVDVPRSLILMGDAKENATKGECVLASDQNDTELYLKFSDIDPKVVWPECEPPDLAESNSGKMLFIIIGAVAVVALIGIGGFVLHHMNQKEGVGGGAFKGKGKGKGKGGYEAGGYEAGGYEAPGGAGYEAPGQGGYEAPGKGW
mmetsp:Transcript_61145/g.111999  ORF Transcript_61145/g.111999 Transcript_61145/m.111999 type:complete len:311 (+) Transcript_61145:34-966(+)